MMVQHEVLPHTLQVCCAPTHPQLLLTRLISQEPLLSEGKRPVLRQLVQQLVAKLQEPQPTRFDLFKVRPGGCWCVTAVTAHTQQQLQQLR